MITATDTLKLPPPSVYTKYEIDVREVVRIQSISNYSKLIFRNGKTLVVARVLVRFEEELRNFVRVHRTHLVNADHIAQFVSKGRREKVELTNGELIDVSRRKAGLVKT